jgi:hypothetical protein
MSMDNKLKTALAEYIRGNRETLEIHGNRVLLVTLYEAAESSRELLASLREGKDEENVLRLMERRKAAMKRWKNVTGESWPF